jgi:hypothetical protein
LGILYLAAQLLEPLADDFDYPGSKPLQGLCFGAQISQLRQVQSEADVILDAG